MADGLLNKASIILTPTGYKAGTLYNVAPIDEPYEDFDFARASVASRVNSSGLVEMVGRTLSSELITDGSFPDGTTAWTFSNPGGTHGWRIADGKAICDTNAVVKNRTLQSSYDVEYGKTYKLTIDIVSSVDEMKLLINTTFIDDGLGNDIELPTGENLGYIVYFTANASGNFRIYGQTSDFQEIDNVSVKEVIDTNNIPRISYDSNGENGHILLEPTSTNVFLYSEDFSDWNGYQATSNTTTAPDGSTIAFLDFEDVRMFPTTTVSDSTEYTSSIYLKANKTADVKIRNVAGQDTIFTLTTDWVRYDLTATTSLTSTNSLLIDARFSQGLGASGLEIALWGGQIEALPYATSYIPTYGSTVTRATETLTGSGNSTLINSTEGVLYAEIAALADDISGFRVLGISDGGSTNRIFIGYSSNNIYANVGAATTIGSAYTPTNASSFHKVALKYENNNCKFFVNGSQIGSTTTSVTIPSGMNSLQFDSGAGGSDFYGKCKALAVFDEALSDSELTQLTT